MKRGFWMSIASLLLIGLPFLAAGSLGAQEEPRFAQPEAVEIVEDDRIKETIVKGQILVTLHEGVKVEDLEPIFERMEAKFEVVHRIESMNHYTLATDHERLPELKQRLANHPYVAASGFNRVMPPLRVFNDPVFQKPPDEPEDQDNWNLHRINAPDAWDVTTGDALVAVIDSGAKLDHEDLVGRTVNPYSFATGGEGMQEGMKKIKEGDQYVYKEVRDHGTHVAITIGGTADNAAGTVGVAPTSRIMPLQALTYRHLFPAEDAGQISGFDNHVLQAMAMATDRGAAVMNMSLGYTDPALRNQWIAASSEEERREIGRELRAKADDMLDGYAPFIDRANRTGTIIVTSAGNARIPAEFEAKSLSGRVISVASTGRDDERAFNSNYGEYTTVSAPGVEIWSGLAQPGRSYDYMSGTSMACPHAAGVVALMKTIDPDLRQPDVADILVTTGRRLDTDQPIGPLINARAALEETRRRRDLGIRVEDPQPPLVPPPGVNPPTVPQLPRNWVLILRGPNPWNDPNLQRIIRVWLAFAIARPPAGGNPNWRWFFNLNGQVVNNWNLLTIPRPIWVRLNIQINFRWLWENAQRLDSTNMGTLYEFTIGTLRQGTFDPAPTRMPEAFRPREDDPRPPKPRLPRDPNLAKTKWDGKDPKGEPVKIEFGDKDVTITRAGKTTLCALWLDPFVRPLTMHFYPKHGGDPIFCSPHVTDLGEIKLGIDPDTRFTLARTEPAPAPVTPRIKKPAPRPVAIGFQPGDGRKVHPHFARVLINDGASMCAGEVGKYAGDNRSAGPRTGIAFNNLAGFPAAGRHWVIRKFTNADGPRRYIDKRAKEDPRFGTSAVSRNARFVVKDRDVAADHVKATVEKSVGRYQSSDHMYCFIYRETFLVFCHLCERKRGHDYKAESERLAEASKKLIDERFPAR